MTLDVITTALCRPDVLAMTYQSFLGGFGIRDLPEVRIILNVDPLGKGNPFECVDIARRYSDHVIHRIASKPSFSAAVNWSIERIESPYFLWLEDDWFLRRRLSYESVLNELLTSNVSQVVFPMGSTCRDNSSYSFRPHLGLARQIKAVPPVPMHQNPEKWIASVLGTGASVDYPLENLVMDLGRKWAKAYGLKKVDDTSWYENRGDKAIGQLEYGFLKARVRTILSLRKRFFS